MADSVALDVIPYFEQDLEYEGARELALREIQAEMALFKPRKAEYLSHLPPPITDLFGGRPLLKSEMERVAAKKPLQAIDLSRYEFPAVDSHHKSDLNAWKQCIERAKTLLEYQNTRLLNLELLSKHGTNAWRMNCEIINHMHAKLSDELNALQDEIQEVNRVRKNDQTKEYEKVYDLESKWYALTQKNLEIEHTCAYMESQLQQNPRQ